MNSPSRRGSPSRSPSRQSPSPVKCSSPTKSRRLSRQFSSPQKYHFPSPKKLVQKGNSMRRKLARKGLTETFDDFRMPTNKDDSHQSPTALFKIRTSRIAAAVRDSTRLPMPSLNLGVVKADHQVTTAFNASEAVAALANPLLMDKTFAIKPVMKMLDPIQGSSRQQYQKPLSKKVSDHSAMIAAFFNQGAEASSGVSSPQQQHRIDMPTIFVNSADESDDINSSTIFEELRPNLI